jgi:hypothetical protein
MADLVTKAYGTQVAPRGSIEELVRNLPASVAAALRWTSHNLIPDRGPVLPVLVDATISSRPPKSDLIAARTAAEIALLPSTPEDCVDAMTELWIVARRKSTSADDGELTLAIYAKALVEFPAGVVEQACAKWLRSSPFWPSVSELLEACRNERKPRQLLLLAIKLALRDADQPPPLPPESMTERTCALRDLWLKRGLPHRAAKYERYLARIESRDVAEWAALPAPQDNPPEAA